MGCNCKKKSCNECCPRTIRGPIGKTGPQGKQGLQGPAGPTGPGGVNGTEITGTDIVILATDGLITITGATFTPAAGTYIVWFDCGIQTDENTLFTYGVYVNGVLHANARLFSPHVPSKIPFLHAGINAIVVTPGAQAIDVRGVVTGSTGITISSYTLIYQKIA